MSLRVAAGIVLDGEKIFLARRAAGRSHGGLWEFPGGKIEEGEDAPACLLREFREEFGADIRPGPFLARIEADGVTLICHFAFLVSPIVSMPDHDALAWVPREGLGSFRPCPADLEAVGVIMALDEWPPAF